MTIELEQLAQLQERLDNLEMRNAFQDDVIEQLNNELSLHQEVIRGLNEQLRLIGQKVKDMNSLPADGPEDDRPPHY